MKKKLSQVDLRYLPRCAGEYIKLVIKKMRYRKQVQADVLAELASDFEEELKECTGDEQKQQIARQLIDEFGDVKLLAALLRRAKKRCRPLWRTIVARTFQVIGVLILCFIFYIVWFLTGKPVITTNYVAEFNKIVRPPADESLNAAQLYNKAVDLCEETSDDFLLFFAKNHQAVVDEKDQGRAKELAGKIDEFFSNSNRLNLQEERQDIQDEVSGVLLRFMGKKYNELTVGQRRIADRWLHDHNDALELIIEGSRRPYYWREYETETAEGGMIGVLMPNLSDFRRFAFNLRLRAWLRAEQGRYQDASDDVKSCYRFGQHLKGDKILIEQLVGIAIEALSVQTIRDILGEYEIDSTVLADLQDSFEQIVAGENFVASLKAEKLCVYDEIQRCFTEDRFGGGHLYLSRISSLTSDYQNDVMDVETIFSPQQWPRAVKVLFAHPDKEKTRKTADCFYDFWTKLYLKTPCQIKAEVIDAEKEALEIIEGNVFLQILAPPLARVNQIAYRNKTDVHATVAVLAILRYSKDKGSYPNDLQQLITAGYLRQLPMDSFSDKPLVYRKTDDDFILYSVGPNFTDEGGEYSRDSKGRIQNWLDNGDAVFWPAANSEALK
ncbi:MAG: hypothetical protein H8D56_20120 [Planctomycetes bacterium]|nr:hypothetical protein [Planctomycetota bacterium]MBL7144845.1 hypothetical protein [Phycisphaerae bacterium]